MYHPDPLQGGLVAPAAVSRQPSASIPFTACLSSRSCPSLVAHIQWWMEDGGETWGWLPLGRLWWAILAPELTGLGGPVSRTWHSPLPIPSTAVDPIGAPSIHPALYLHLGLCFLWMQTRLLRFLLGDPLLQLRLSPMGCSSRHPWWPGSKSFLERPLEARPLSQIWIMLTGHLKTVIFTKLLHLSGFSLSHVWNVKNNARLSVPLCLRVNNLWKVPRTVPGT